MKNFLEKLKDFIYDYIDFVMISVVVVLIGVIIFWRLDILFDDAKIDENNTKDIKTEEPKNEDKSKDEKEPNTEEPKVEKDNDKNKEEDSKDEETSGSNENIEINIEKGSSSETIAQILLDKKLINDKRKFLLRLSDLNLETKLRPGTFELNNGTDIDTIIKTLANQI